MARYIPKSKVSILQTTGNEFVVASTNQPYKGTYMELSDGTFFAGNNPQNPGEELLKKKPLSISFGVSRNNSTYRKLKRSVYDNLSKITPIPPSKPKPTTEDYKRGYFTRYFCVRANENKNYFEINKETYNLVLKQDPKYDFSLYKIGKIKWVILEKNNQTIASSNQNLLNLKSIDFPLIQALFNNLEEHKPLYTEGGYSTSDKNVIPYTGYYHIHPENGYAMEGPYHVSTKHRRLYLISNTTTTGVSLSNTQQSSRTPNIGSSNINRTPTPTSPSGPTSSPGRGGY